MLQLPQTQLSATKRTQNLIGAFSVKKSFQDRHIAILDDVITTGTTINEVAKLLIDLQIQPKIGQYVEPCRR